MTHVDKTNWWISLRTSEHSIERMKMMRKQHSSFSKQKQIDVYKYRGTTKITSNQFKRWNDYAKNTHSIAKSTIYYINHLITHLTYSSPHSHSQIHSRSHSPNDTTSVPRIHSHINTLNQSYPLPLSPSKCPSHIIPACACAWGCTCNCHTSTCTTAFTYAYKYIYTYNYTHTYSSIYT